MRFSRAVSRSVKSWPIFGALSSRYAMNCPKAGLLARPSAHFAQPAVRSLNQVSMSFVNGANAFEIPANTVSRFREISPSSWRSSGPSSAIVSKNDSQNGFANIFALSSARSPRTFDMSPTNLTNPGPYFSTIVRIAFSRPGRSPFWAAVRTSSSSGLRLNRKVAKRCPAGERPSIAFSSASSSVWSSFVAVAAFCCRRVMSS